MKTLTQMGIQQWRLKASFSQAMPAGPTGDVAVSEAIEQVESAVELSSSTQALGMPAAEMPTSIPEPSQMSVEPFEPDLSANQLSSVDVATASVPLTVVDEVAIEDQPALDRDLANLDWPGLQRRIDSSAHCPSCGLDNAHLGAGDVNADWMFVVDAPNSREIAARHLFTGRAGQLFDAILLALNLERQQVYSTSVFKCAPVDDLSIAPQCDELMHRQIALVNPKVVIAFGEFAAQAVIKSNHKLDLLRQTEQLCVRTQTPVMATYSPSEMLNDTALKAFVWQDLKKCMRLVNA